MKLGLGIVFGFEFPLVNVVLSNPNACMLDVCNLKVYVQVQWWW